MVIALRTIIIEQNEGPERYIAILMQSIKKSLIDIGVFSYWHLLPIVNKLYRIIYIAYFSQFTVGVGFQFHTSQ